MSFKNPSKSKKAKEFRRRRRKKRGNRKRFTPGQNTKPTTESVADIYVEAEEMGLDEPDWDAMTNDPVRDAGPE